MDFEKGFIFSVKQLRHPVIFVPDLVLLLTTLVLGFGLFSFSGMSQIVSGLALSESFQQELFRDLLADKWASLVVGVIVVFVITFIVGVGADILRFSLIKDLVDGKRKLDLVRAWRSSKGMFWDVVVLKILVYLLSILVLLVLALVGWALYLVVGEGFSVWPYVGVLSLFGLLLLALLRLFLLFRYPILFIERGRSPVDVLMKSFRFVKSNLWYAFLILLIMVITMLVFSLLTSPLSVCLDYLQALIAAGTFWAVIFAYFAKLVRGIVSIVYAVWMHLFVFNSYAHRKIKRGL